MIYQIILYVFVVFTLNFPGCLWGAASQALQEANQDSINIITDEAPSDTPPPTSFDTTTLENTALAPQGPEAVDGVSTSTPLTEVAAHDNVQPIMEEDPSPTPPTEPPLPEATSTKKEPTSEPSSAPLSTEEITTRVIKGHEPSLDMPPPEPGLDEPVTAGGEPEKSTTAPPFPDIIPPKDATADVKHVNTATIEDAMKGAYDLSFLMLAEYKVKGSQNELIHAKSDWLPQTYIKAGYAYQTQYNKQTNVINTQQGQPVGSTTNESSSRNYGPQATLNLEQNLFNGGATTANIKASHKNLESAIAAYRHAEQEVLLNAVKAHIELVASEKIHHIKEAYLTVIEHGLEVAANQHEYGEKTSYDVAVNQAKVNEVRSEAIGAHNQIEAAKAAYIKVTGLDPKKDLVGATEPLNLLPKTKEEALQLCLQHNPVLQQLEAEAGAAQSKADYDLSGLLPKVDAIGSLSKSSNTTVNHSVYSSPSAGQSHSATATLNLTIPLDFAGTAQARIRSAKYTAAQKRLTALIQRRSILEAASQKWDKLESEHKKVIELKSHVEATRVAADVVKEEFLAGTKTTLEMVTATHEYFKAQENLIIAEQTVVLSAYELLASIGILSAKNLGLEVETFDPKAAYDNMGWYGTHIGLDERFDKQIEHNARMIPGVGA